MRPIFRLKIRQITNLAQRIIIHYYMNYMNYIIIHIIIRVADSNKRENFDSVFFLCEDKEIGLCTDEANFPIENSSDNKSIRAHNYSLLYELYKLYNYAHYR